MFAIYNGKEYEVSPMGEDSYALISTDLKDLKQGFSQHFSGKYIKNVKRDTLQELYFINTLALYRGHKFGVSAEKDDQLLIGTSDYELLEKFNLVFVDRGVYEKWVDKCDLEKIWEEKTTI